MRTITAAALALAWASSAPAADLELKGHRIGSLRSELPASGWDCSRPQRPIAEEVCWAPGGTLANAPMRSMMLMYFEGKLQAINASINQSNFAAVHSALVQKFGAPANSEISEIRNRMGASFENRVTKWAHPAGSIEAEERSGSVDQSSVLIRSADYDAKVEALKAGAASRGAADL